MKTMILLSLKEVVIHMNEKKRNYWMAVLIMFPMVLLITYRLSAFSGTGLSEFIDYAGYELMERPFYFKYTDKALKVMAVVTFIYFATAFLIISSIKNTRHGAEHGSARLESPGYINRQFKTKKKMLPEYMKDMNIGRTYILCSKKIRISIVSQCSNLNILLIGAPGTGKSRKFIIPNIMQMNSNMVITDPKGEIASKVGKMLVENGYEVKILDLKNQYRSHGYNPFIYFRDENDVFLFVNNMWEAMSDKSAQKGEQIWDDQAKNMLMSIILYLYSFAPYDEQNFDMVLEILSVIDSSEDTGNDNLPKRHERLFENIPHDSTAYRYYTMWNTAKGRTLSSIVATLSAKMAVFSLSSMRRLTYHDEMDILSLADKKVAVFMLLPDNNRVFNFLAGTLYVQMFQQLYDYADNVCHGPLPRHVTFYMDEFPNVALPDDYDKILSTSRSRNISFAIVLQDKSQIEALYRNNYRTLIADCAFKIFLGSNEYETCKYFSDMLGKETIVTYTYNRTYGMRGSTTRNEQLQARELLTADELMTDLKPDECIFCSSNKYAVRDKKNDITYHDMYKEISDGAYRDLNIYEWGSDRLSRGMVKLISNDYPGCITPLRQKDRVEWDLMDSEEIEKMIMED